ncbi:unnamed protein product [Nippostrongylus brasiliensis]|uniref:SHSP domain-containing protein n=1 Tax=Nippostrongylus brasiliensis TaxID=27835 RepID=A0A0N4XPQ0_NIPBR|nr:unnamed protein product [Nippostrongylus brasiliensis]
MKADIRQHNDGTLIIRGEKIPSRKPLPRLERVSVPASGPCDRSADGGKLSRSQDGPMVACNEVALKSLRSRTIWPPHKELRTETGWQCGTSTENAGAAPRREKTGRLS